MATTETETATASIASSRLVELPEELVSNISVKLGSDDIYSFRLTCKVLEQKSFHEFATEYFRAKCFIFTSDSLKVLVNIASSKKLRGHLHELFIIPALFSDRVFNCSNGPNCRWQPTTRQSEAWHQYTADQQALKQTGRDLELLTEAFKQLPALDRLTFADRISALPRDVDLRGITKAVRSTNNNPAVVPANPKDKEFYRWKNHVWRTVIQALAASESTTLSRFSTDLDQIKNALSVAVNFDIDEKTLSGIRTALTKVHCVGLHISSRKQSKPDEEDDGIDTKKGGQAMEKFSALLPSLKRLRLSFSYSPSSNALCTSFLNKVNLPQLTMLSLESVWMDAKPFCVMISKLTSATDLHLNWVNLVSGSWIPVLKVIQKMEKLHHLHLFWSTENGDRVYFVKPLPKDATNEAIPHPPPFPHTIGGAHDDDDDDESGYLDDDSGEDYSDHDALSIEGETSSELVTDSEEDEDYDDSDEDNDDLFPAVEGDIDADPDSDTDDSMPELEPQDAPTAPSAGSAISPGIAMNDTTTNPTTTATSEQSQVDDYASVLLDTYHAIPPPVVTSVLPTLNADAAANSDHNHSDIASLGEGPDRGLYICLKGSAQLQKYLPIFIDEYNLHGDDEEAEAEGDAMNTFMNALGGVFGAGPPVGMFGNTATGGVFTMMGPPPPPPQPPATAGNVAGAAGPGQGTATNGGGTGPP